MIKNRTIIEVELKGREYRLECAPESTWEDVVQALAVLHATAEEKIKAFLQQKEQQEKQIENIEIIEENE